jgi:hypothetical protein
VAGAPAHRAPQAKCRGSNVRHGPWVKVKVQNGMKSAVQLSSLCYHTISHTMHPDHTHTHGPTILP